jgi:penicillin-binding protein 1C
LLVDQGGDLEFVDRTGKALREASAGYGPFRRSVEYGQIPQVLIEATLAAEDRRFFRHAGFDWRATFRAVWQWARHGHAVSGGSTITQQLIKLAEPRPRTIRSKIIEAAQALRLEQVWDKQTILAAYLNRLDYGNFNRGCAVAARFYFGKPLADLSPAECAFLAGLPQAPSRLNPRSHFDRAARRQRWVLGQMRRAGWLTDDEHGRAAAETLRLAAPVRRFEAPHFVDLLMAGPGGEEPRRASGRPGKIRTTLDLDLNQFAEGVLRRHLSGLRSQRVSNGSIVALDNKTGDVLALVGSESYFAPVAGQVNGAWAPRSTGSALKPFTYLLAMERGATPATVVADVPTDFATATGLFSPVNYDRHCYGPARYRLALANSLNISAVKTLASIGGPAPLRDFLRECGLTTLNRPAEDFGLGLTIGNAEARLLELANAYACLARLGEYKPYRLVLDAPVRLAEASRRVASPENAFLLADILSDNDARAVSFGPESPLRFDFPVACKTGTSSDFRDNWAFGYTPEYTVGVWVGNFDGSPMRRVSGVTGAAPILHELFEHLRQSGGVGWYATPGTIVERWINPITGKLLAEQESPSPGAVREKFLASNLPTLESANDRAAKAAVLGVEYRDWLASGDNWLGDKVALAPNPDSVRIVFPPPGSTIYLDPDLPDHGRRLWLRAEGPEDLQWRSDSLQVVAQDRRSIALLAPGRHQLIARNSRTGAEAQTWIEVLAR